MVETAYLSPKLVLMLERVKARDHDDTVGATARRLLRKALESEGIEVEEGSKA